MGEDKLESFLTQPLVVCCCFISHTSPEQIQPVLLWQISQASPDVMDFSSAPRFSVAFTLGQSVMFTLVFRGKSFTRSNVFWVVVLLEEAAET